MPTHHVIIGGGPAGINAIETIREVGTGDSKITLIGDEPAHARMALPYWLSGDVGRDHTLIADDAYYSRLDVESRIGARVTEIDANGKELKLDDGSDLRFDKLLIATGSAPLGLPVPGVDLPGVQSLWTLADTQGALDVAGDRKPRVVMIGSGFIGFIMLNAMYKRGWSISVVEREAQILPRMLDARAAAIVSEWLVSKGAEVHCGTTVTNIRSQGDAKLVELENGATIEADLVIVATGVKPNVELAVNAGIEASADGIAVNDRLQTNFPDIYAAGDVARGPVYYSSDTEIHAIQPTAVDHGRVVGANMAGQDVSYSGSLLMNILDVCGLQCASYGNWLDATAEEMTMENPDSRIYRKLMWTGDELTGAMFVGRAQDVGMLTDLGMVKGLMQTRTNFGPWKDFLRENPFDIRRAYIANEVASKLAGQTLLGRPSKTRQYIHGDSKVSPQAGPGHSVFVSTKPT